MFTQCPQCNAIFQVSADQLKAAAGDVRCGQCLSVFNALAHLSEELPHAHEPDTTDKLAQDANHYSRWTAETTETPLDSATEASATELTAQAAAEASSTAEDDIFSEVIATAEATDISDEEIDRFEEFLAEAPSPLEDSADLADFASIESSLAAEDHVSAIDALSPEEDALPIEESLSAENSSSTKTSPFATYVDTTKEIASHSTVVEESTVVDETDVVADDNHFGDREAVSADLYTQIPLENDDEFAELDAYLNDTDDEFNDFRSSDSSDSDSDNIIIEAADLEPVTSPAYTDTPLKSGVTASNETVDDLSDASPAEPTAADVVAKAASNKTATGNEPPVLNIPSLILDDLNAAKAEQLRPRNTGWVIGTLVLMFTLVVQVVYHARNDLAKDPSLRPLLVQMCHLVGCSLSQPYDIDKIEIIGRDVRSHPTARKALIASTTLINNATFVQPFPLLTMVFADINGKEIARRRFTPREYLDNSVDLAAGMQPDTPVRIELELVDPGKAAVNYEFHAQVDPRATRPLT